MAGWWLPPWYSSFTSLLGGAVMIGTVALLIATIVVRTLTPFLVLILEGKYVVVFCGVFYEMKVADTNL